MKRVIILFVGTFTLFSCGVDEVGLDVSDNATPNSAISSQYSISEEEALANLYAFMGEGGDSRSSDNRVVSTVLPVKYGDLGTRAVDGIDCENLLYIANFENEEGYAILAGDTRIEDEVIAITDGGSLESEVLNNVIIDWENNGRTYYDGYPTTGPGFYTTPETGDELFMNPNTVNIYIEEENDWLIGNVFHNTIDTIGSRGATENYQDVVSSEAFTLSLCMDYATRGIIEFDPNPRDDGIDGEFRYVTTTSDWYDSTTTQNLLTFATLWKQDSPYNDLCPVRTENLVYGDRQKAPAGCFPVSVAKVLTYFRFPDTYTYNGFTVDWQLLKQFPPVDSAIPHAALLFRSIGAECSSWYFYSWTFTRPKKVRNFLSSMFYKDVEIKNYSFNTIRDMIDNRYPVIIYGIESFACPNGHAWNIDGYKIKERTTTTEIYLNDILQRTEVETESKKMVHCDFGWGGDCNGYYISGVFDLGDTNNIENDAGFAQTDNYNYDTLMKIISYNGHL